MRRLSIALLLVMALTAGLMVAQDDEPLLCDEAELVAMQAEFASQLADFGEQLAGDPETTLETLYTVGQNYQEMALSCGYIPANAAELMVGSDIDRIMVVLAEMSGDPLNGQLLYNGEANAADGGITGCVGCHSEAVVAPLTEGTWTRWDEIRRNEPQFEDYTFEQYTVESIIHPWDYLVPDYMQVMPNNFGDRLSYQNLADLIAYLASQDQLLDD